MDHNKWDESSHLLKHTHESQHTHVWNDDFKIINGTYKSNIKRKVSKALYIRTLKPTFNVKENSVRFELYNRFSCRDFTIKQLYKFDFD